MTNKERYQRAFSALHASEDYTFTMEGRTVKNTNKRYAVRIVAACAAVILVLGLASVAYAADIGHIQRTIQLWVDGDRTDAVLEIENGTYSMTYTDRDGGVHEQVGGGRAFDIFGNEVPMTEDELLAPIGMPDVEYEDDGTVWVWWYGQRTEITDKFENGFCYVQLKNGSDVLYLTVQEGAGYAFSTNKFIDAKTFR